MRSYRHGREGREMYNMHLIHVLIIYVFTESSKSLVPEQIHIDKTDGESVLHNRFTLVLIIFYGSLPRMDIKKNGFNLSLRLIRVLLSFCSSLF